jgi:ABC-type phosphate/phosphonate transport system permease subunit
MSNDTKESLLILLIGAIIAFTLFYFKSDEILKAVIYWYQKVVFNLKEWF